ncbi:receptor kinase-like protein Xa21 [Hibiscus syriacus]|uniref:receptor kinase-like protein Xa21 n=1 Tax=Hibiscus syriacus TaxID=106335 RepID=UPI001922601C|nr:receptor kinase-like protein Xa21 [Hibiscus syriacus]
MVGNYSELQHLSLFGNNFIGSIPHEIATDIAGEIPREISNLRDLRPFGTSSVEHRVSASETYTPSPSSEQTHWQAPQLHHQCFDTQGHRTRPQVVFQLSSESLWHISIESTAYRGVFPASIGNLSNLLLYFYAGGSGLKGNTLMEIGNLSRVIEFSVWDNGLVGPIPAVGRLQRLEGLFLNGSKLQGSIPNDTCELKMIYKISLQSNLLDGSVPACFDNLTALRSLNLDSNKLISNIPSTLWRLSNLLELNLSSNFLRGSVPLDVGNLKDQIPDSFGHLMSLEFLDLLRNRLSGVIRKSMESFGSNEALCGSPRLHVLPCKAGSDHRSEKVSVLVLKCILPAIVSAMLLVTLIIILLRSRKSKPKVPIRKTPLPPATWRRISYYELRVATDGFNESCLIGTGTFGSVYKAVKVFDLRIDRAFLSFESECERLNIMIDVALALEHLLHHGHQTPEIHCDLKPENVLLDEDMVAHVGDFGIAKLLGEEESMKQTITMATIGYMAPEYGTSRIVSTEGDVYSFGILLMETLTRKKQTDETFTDELSLTDLVKELFDSLTNVIDAAILQEGEVHLSAKTSCISSVLELALDCSAESPKRRRKMVDVVANSKRSKPGI